MDWLQRINKDRLGAILIILMGVGVAVQGTQYRIGELTRMGAGFMPVVYGSLMAFVGVLLMITAQRGPDAAGHPPEWRGWLCILGGVASFVVLGHYGGFAPAAFASVFISALGDRGNSVRDAALLALVITLAGYAIFIRGLGLPFPLFAWGA